MATKNVCDDHELREFIDKYKLHQIEEKLISEGITINFLLSQTEPEMVEISEELTSNKIQQNKLKAAVREIKRTKLSSNDSNQEQSFNHNNKRKNPYSNQDTSCSKRQKIDISETSNNALPSTSGLETCSICGSSMSLFLIDNHKRHCLNNYNKKEEDKNIESPPPQSPQHDDIENEENEENVLIECKFCEFEYSVSMESDHEYHCGARTDLCSICKQRDTLRNFMENKHKCYQHSNDTKNDNKIQNEWRPKFERQLYDLQKILHDRFVMDYNKCSSHFEQYDVFGNKKKIYSQKSNECISNIRGYNMNNNNNNNNCNDSRYKYSKNERKSKDELRREYDEKYKKILNLLKKIIVNVINNASDPKYKKLRCDNDKLKRLIFCYPQCCEFLKLCNFQYIDNMYYEMINIDDERLKIALDALKCVDHSFQNKIESEDKKQKKWESKQAIETNKSSPFHGCWACKKCNHLNTKKALKCSNCRWKKQSIQKTKKPIINLSVQKWICGICGNRNAMEFLYCDNCKNSKIAIL